MGGEKKTPQTPSQVPTSPHVMWMQGSLPQHYCILTVGDLNPPPQNTQLLVFQQDHSSEARSFRLASVEQTAVHTEQN